MFFWQNIMNRYLETTQRYHLTERLSVRCRCVQRPAHAGEPTPSPTLHPHALGPHVHGAGQSVGQPPLQRPHPAPAAPGPPVAAPSPRRPPDWRGAPPGRPLRPVAPVVAPTPAADPLRPAHTDPRRLPDSVRPHGADQQQQQWHPGRQHAPQVDGAPARPQCAPQPPLDSDPVADTHDQRHTQDAAATAAAAAAAIQDGGHVTAGRRHVTSGRPFKTEVM